ncbi:hypothetical protein JCM8547_006999 [Rhodosporidiobolus lusitaniae]
MPNLVVFRCEGNGEISNEQLRRFKDVEHLVHRFMNVPSFPSILFRDLVPLTMHDLYFPMNNTAVHLPSSCFPSLEALYTTCEQYNNLTGQMSLVEPAALGNQLDLLQVSLKTHQVFPSDLPDRDVPVLLAFSLEWINFLLMADVSWFRHFQLNAWAQSRYDDPWQFHAHKLALQQLREAVAAHAHLKSLSFPCLLHPSSSSSLESDQHSIRDDLLTTCASRNVDIIWRLNSKKPVDDEAVSKDF